jgi:hypothetical protein
MKSFYEKQAVKSGKLGKIQDESSIDTHDLEENIETAGNTSEEADEDDVILEAVNINPNHIQILTQAYKEVYVGDGDDIVPFKKHLDATAERASSGNFVDKTLSSIDPSEAISIQNSRAGLRMLLHVNEMREFDDFCARINPSKEEIDEILNSPHKGKDLKNLGRIFSFGSYAQHVIEQTLRDHMSYSDREYALAQELFVRFDDNESFWEGCSHTIRKWNKVNIERTKGRRAKNDTAKNFVQARNIIEGDFTADMISLSKTAKLLSLE